MSSSETAMIKKILSEIINSTAGLKHVIIIDETGITIASQSKFNIADEGVSVEKIGAIGGAVFSAGEEQGEILGFGPINLQITEYDKGLLLSVKIGRGILCISADLNVQIGYVRALVKKYKATFSSLLEKYLKTDQEGVNKELKELFQSDTSFDFS